MVVAEATVTTGDWIALSMAYPLAPDQEDAFASHLRTIQQDEGQHSQS